MALATPRWSRQRPDAPTRVRCIASGHDRHLSLEFLKKSRPLIYRGGRSMPEFVFEVSLKAIVRVRAETEADARQALTSSVLRSPSANDIRLANEANFIAGMEGTMTEVDFSIVDNSVKLKNVLDEGS